jgi:Ca2+-binding RTX toxin-like protein
MAAPLRGLLTFSLTTWAVMLGAPSAEAVSDTCVYDDTTKTVQISFPDGPGQARTVSREAGGNHIVYNGATCGDATVRNTDSILVSATDGAQELTVDLSNGPFAPGPSPEAGIDEIEMSVDLGNGTDSLVMIGSDAADSFFFDYRQRLGTNRDQDGDLTPTGVERWTFSMGDGGDSVYVGRGIAFPVAFFGEGGHDGIEGSGADDTLVGGAGDDQIHGSIGRDLIVGGGGNDELVGEEDDDVVRGGLGDDLLDGGPGDDVFLAEAAADGSDRFVGGLGDDGLSYRDRVEGVHLDLYGGSNDGEGRREDDQIHGDVENLEGGAGNDRLTGSDGVNTLIGNGGDDDLDGNKGDDQLFGNAGNDVIDASAGDDLLVGGGGDDDLLGSYGNDTLSADAGADGDDDYRGGVGTDTLTYAARSNGVEVAIGTHGNGGPGERDHVQDFIEIVEGGAGADTITGIDADETLIGNAGTDTLNGAAGADVIRAGSGADAIDPGDGADEVFGDEGDDVLHLTDGGTDVADCGAGTDDASDRDSFDVALTACEIT